MTLTLMIAALVAPPLTPVEQSNLLHMREEEKVARDVYKVLAEKWGQRPFGNIVRAETQHMAQVKGLLVTYGLPDPITNDTPGKFTDQRMQKLYDRLTKEGLQSRTAALKVGAEIEELDIADLNRMSKQTERADIKSVFANLTKGSENHLRAFMRSLTNSGETYTPKHLSQAEFDRILGR